jgi:hypothetical protein
MKTHDSPTSLRFDLNSRAASTARRGLVLSAFAVALISASGALTLSDGFAGRTVATGSAASFSGSNSAAGDQLDEPPHDSAARRTLWAAWTAPDNGEVTIDTLGSNFNTAIAVYTGTNLAALNPVARNRNAPNVDQSRVVFPTRKGVTYSIAIDGETSGSNGTALLQVAFSPRDQPAGEVGSDAFSGRPLLAGASALGACNNVYFTLDALEPLPFSAARRTAWWRWIAPGDGNVVIDTFGSNFNTVLAVHVGSDIATLSPVAMSTDTSGGLQSRVSFQARSGQEYQIMVDGQTSGSYGNALVSLAWTANTLPGAVAGGDGFEQRGRLAGLNAEGVAMNLEFDLETEPAHVSARHRTAWWEWTAPANGTVRIRTEGSELTTGPGDFNTGLDVYEGTSLGGLVRKAQNDNVSGALWSDVSFTATRGTVYQIAVGGATSGSYGNIRLRVDQAVPPAEILAIYPAVEIEVPGATGVRYQLQWSPDLIGWSDFGEVITGAGVPVRILDPVRGTPRRYYRYRTLP